MANRELQWACSHLHDSEVVVYMDLKRKWFYINHIYDDICPRLAIQNNVTMCGGNGNLRDLKKIAHILYELVYALIQLGARNKTRYTQAVYQYRTWMICGKMGSAMMGISSVWQSFRFYLFSKHHIFHSFNHLLSFHCI